MSGMSKFEVKQARIKLMSLCAALLIFSAIISLSAGGFWPWLLPVVFVLLAFSVLAPLKLMFLIRGMDHFHLCFRKILIWCFFYLFVVPSSWVLRIIRPNIIPLKIDKKTLSYWQVSEKKQFTDDDFTKQY